ncbi:hypothetical protein QYM36_003374, partial [Artemia franciscana]
AHTMTQAFQYASLISILLAIVICQEQPGFSALGQLPKRDFDRGQPRVIRRVAGADRFFFNTRYGKRSGPVDNLGYLGSSEYQSDPVGNGLFFASKYGKREGSRDLAGYGGLRGSQRFFINGRYGKRSMDINGGMDKMNTKQSSSSSSSDEEEDESFAKACLKAHNEYRALHNVKSLKLNKKLCKYAQEWAEKLSHDGQMMHRQNCIYGENLFSIWTTESSRVVTGKEPVAAWYSEIEKYNFGQEPADSSAGHFTQLVWKETKLLGVGFSKSVEGKFFIVCNYHPTGNFLGEYEENVLPPIPSKKKPAIASPKPVTKPSKKKKKSKFENNVNEKSNGEEVKETKLVLEEPNKSFTTQRFVTECLEAHNKYRRNHNVPEVEIDEAISKYATEWAKKISLNDKMEHRPERKYGENIYCFWSNSPNFQLSGNAPVETWYKEIEDHEFGKEPKTAKTETLVVGQKPYKQVIDQGRYTRNLRPEVS